ncbi:RNA polymerase sigma factor [Tomitella fengzijianii]|uniref:RNA polymerase sigma factor n=1 Tax=Tomitella fengzijianii TaxID=2597660 RepID=A0A516WZ22_9ACTN|nr:RNA polymerase sigma factor [Tomitella fengzijianii]
MTRHRTPPRSAAADARVPFQRVVEVHGVSVLRVCRALVGPVDADDAWSETFLAALRAYPEMPPGRSVEAWLVTIAQRKCIDMLRSRGRNPEPVAELPPVRSDVGIPGAADEFAPLWHALGRLPLVQRQAVVYHHLVGMPYADAARIIGNSAAAARRAGADGIAALRRALAEPTGTAPPPGAFRDDAADVAPSPERAPPLPPRRTAAAGRRAHHSTGGATQ